MVDDLYPYFNQNQFERFIGQFMRVFSKFQVQDGVDRGSGYLLKKVPVVYGNMSRIVASIMNKRDFFTNERFPMMAVHLNRIELDRENKKSHFHKDAISMRRFGENNTPNSSVERIIGPAYVLGVDLSIYASSNTEMFSLLEQILLIFNPRVTIQTDNSVFNHDYITEISLESVSDEINYPLGTERGIRTITLGFTVPVRLRYPINPDGPIIEQIISTIKEDSEDGVTLTQEIIP